MQSAHQPELVSSSSTVQIQQVEEPQLSSMPSTQVNGHQQAQASNGSSSRTALARPNAMAMDGPSTMANGIIEGAKGGGKGVILLFYNYLVNLFFYFFKFF
jgi:hypothetical protein